MPHFHERIKAFFNNRWLVFVCAMWIQSCSGVGYLFGSFSPVIKSIMGYNQRQLAVLGVFKNFGNCVGFVAGSLSQVLPTWGLLLIGAVHNLIGYGSLWLIVTQRLHTMPLWVLCICIYVGANAETYLSTATLVSCIQNFPMNRGPIVGILKGFSGLSGAIVTQVYAIINAPNQASLILTIAVGPAMVVIALMFIVRPVEGPKQVRASDGSGFLFTYSICLVLAAYLLGVLILEDFLNLNKTLVIFLAIGLIILILLPIIVPVILVSLSKPKPPAEESLLAEPQKQEVDISEQETSEVILNEVEDENSPEVDTLLASERHKRTGHLKPTNLFQEAVDRVMRLKWRKGPRIGENFTLTQALIKAEFWLIFTSLVLAAGSGVTIFDNLGQITQSLGYTDTRVFVAMICIWNFLGRVGGGYFSEIVTRDFAYPRPVSMAIFQLIMTFGFIYYAMGWPGQIYVVTVLIGISYGALWAIAIASVSELFGLKSFGSLYNFLTLANPAGSLIFSELLASGIYDYYAEKQAAHQLQYPVSALTKPIHNDKSLTCEGTICYSLTCGILSGVCIVATMLTLIVVYRTRRVYAQLYGNHIS
ncbi:Major facilitator [Trema orientale]|uniref:Major facilitator n=1 Tax=Trema orientale TaxID=63057 RepID=A0A2P5FDB1_TREOI|nr:Major facilitator [Trema orientale]